MYCEQKTIVDCWKTKCTFPGSVYSNILGLVIWFVNSLLQLFQRIRKKIYLQEKVVKINQNCNKIIYCYFIAWNGDFGKAKQKPSISAPIFFLSHSLFLSLFFLFFLTLSLPSLFLSFTLFLSSSLLPFSLLPSLLPVHSPSLSCPFSHLLSLTLSTLLLALCSSLLLVKWNFVWVFLFPLINCAYIWRSIHHLEKFYEVLWWITLSLFTLFIN